MILFGRMSVIAVSGAAGNNALACWLLRGGRERRVFATSSLECRNTIPTVDDKIRHFWKKCSWFLTSLISRAEREDS